ncbi:prepilin peptidase [Luteolibacter sp. GHJ8]|uniref:Prepilin peptidase n=1 Tax=Luteolibacter rhizosphaerae TaxID=2989719 RepID=A0ABT3G7R6_9BACT|nr:prepilin peptidase [Luteolibacter rhizosphaerae]MCW1915888.1 prepilin peptidase [Luteolibacter rhizosphaerae]
MPFIRLNAFTLIYPSLAHSIWFLPAFLIGACIGSFLNVVIYRVPLGLSVNEPKRSFCPKCKAEIPMRLNVPLVSWLWLRGKCANCRAPISFRYFGVELLTGLLFAAIWWFLRGNLESLSNPSLQLATLLPLWVMVALFVSITFIDAEHMVIPLSLTWAGTVAGLVAAALWPQLPDLAEWATAGRMRPDWLAGIKQSVIGWIIGFCGLWVVVRLGKMAFGNKKMEFTEPVAWRLIEPEGDEDPILFEIGEEKIAWWDIFYRKTDRLIIECSELRLNDAEVKTGTLTIREDGIELPDGRKLGIEEVKALDGKSAKAVIPREAMGFGDVHLMGSIGAFFGWTGVFFSIFAASLLAILAAVLGRIGFGRPLPFGPFLILGSFVWLFGGWRVAQWYFENLVGM